MLVRRVMTNHPHPSPLHPHLHLHPRPHQPPRCCDHSHPGTAVSRATQTPSHGSSLYLLLRS